MRTRKPIVVPDMSTCPTDVERASVAREYHVQSVAFVPVLGGVIEYGTTYGSPTRWTCNEDALKQIIPVEASSHAWIEPYDA